MDVQLSMGWFGAPEVPLVPAVPTPSGVVERPEGWTLYSTKRGTIGYHRTKLNAPFGLVVAWCGARGRPVADGSAEIILCDRCIGAETLFE